MAPTLAGRPRAARQLSAARPALIALALMLAACRPDATSATLDLLLPEGVGRRVELVPRTAFAEYVEIPELRRELRVTLADYELSCDRYVAPHASELLFVLTLVTPPKTPIGPGTFPIGPAPAADAGAEARATAFAVARQGERGFDFPSGGTVELRTVELAASGHVAGVLALEFPGDGTRPAAGAHGRFEARVCRGE